MPRLIDADNLVEVLDEELEDRVKGETIYTNALKSIFLVGFAKQVINDAPTVDAVEVVRCKYCEHYWKNNPSDDVPVCLASPKDNAFCSEGERRKDG